MIRSVSRTLWSVMSTPIPRVFEVKNDLLDVGHGNRIDPGEGLVEQHELRRHDQRPGDLDTPPLPSREGEGGDLASGVRPSSASSSRIRRCRADASRLSVSRIASMFCSTVRPRKIDGFLRQVADALPGPHVHRIVGHVRAVEQHPPRVRCGQPDDHRERRGLAGAIRPEQAHDFPGCDIEADAAERPSGRRKTW